MKKMIYGLGIAAAGAALTTLLWVVVSMAFEVEQSALDRITGAVNVAVWMPMVTYLVTGLFQTVRFRRRFDQESYQPLKKPVSLVATFIVQAIIIALWGRPGSDLGQASLAFVSALILTLVMGMLTMMAALIWGRPIIGTTKLPFTKSDL